LNILKPMLIIDRPNLEIQTSLLTSSIEKEEKKKKRHY